MSEDSFELDVPDMSYSEFIATITKKLDPDANTVLLVDDEKGIRKTVARDVRKFAPDVQIHEAGNGKEALEELAKIRATHRRDPLFIVLDLNMPVMDGWDFIKALKQEYDEKGVTARVPIIVLSSTSGEKGLPFLKKSVHGNKTGYSPLITVAKEVCADSGRYDNVGERGLVAWLKHFAKG